MKKNTIDKFFRTGSALLLAATVGFLPVLENFTTVNAAENNKAYTVKISSDENGSVTSENGKKISGESAYTFKAGEEAKLNMKANKSYFINEVDILNGAENIKVNGQTYSFTAENNATVDVKVSFAKEGTPKLVHWCDELEQNYISYDKKPTKENLVSQMPKTIKVTFSDYTKGEIPVTWDCKYYQDDAEIYEFYPSFDKEKYGFKDQSQQQSLPVIYVWEKEVVKWDEEDLTSSDENVLFKALNMKLFGEVKKTFTSKDIKALEDNGFVFKTEQTEMENFPMAMSAARAMTATYWHSANPIKYSGSNDYYNGDTVNHQTYRMGYTISGKNYTGVCLQPILLTPENGTLMNVVKYNNSATGKYQRLRKIIYYGLSHPDKVPTLQGKNANMQYVYTHCASAYVYDPNCDPHELGLKNQWAMGLTNAQCADVLRMVKEIDALPNQTGIVTFKSNINGKEVSNPTVTAYIKDNVQRTPNIKVDGISTDGANVQVPSGVTMVMNGKRYSSGTVFVAGGSSFYFEAPLTFTATEYKHPSIGSKEGNMAVYLGEGGKRQDIMSISVSDESPTKTNFSVKWLAQGEVSLQKISSDTTLTDGNENYSFAGAEYSIYDNANATGTPKGILTAKADGTSNSVKLSAGTYYVKETKAPLGYELDETIHELTINAGQKMTFKASDVPKTTTIQIAKQSKNPDATNGNNNYSLEGAVYRIYTDSACSKWTGKDITTDKDGNGSITGLALDEYWIKEYSAPSGYFLDKTIYYADGRNKDGVDVVNVKINPKEPPKVVSPKETLAIMKVDSETGKSEPQGNATLEGAHFLVKYYVQITNGKDPAKDGLKPLRTWTLKTGKDGKAYYDEEHKVSGDNFFKNSITGKIVLPIGTYTFEEVKSPNGYLLNSEISVLNVNEPIGNEDREFLVDVPVQKENVLQMKLQKLQAGTKTAIQGAEFEHTLPNGSKERLTTDKDGRLSFKGLQWGKHIVQEISAPAGYIVNTNKIEFTVAEDNTITITSQSTETDTNGMIICKVEKDGNLSATVFDKPALFTLQVNKKNEKDKVLEGAEFTLYSDKECKTVVQKIVTNEAGTLSFKNLVPMKDYYMKETKAPAGYRIPVNKDGTEIVYHVRVESNSAENKFDFIVNGKTYTADSDGVFRVEGSKSDRIAVMDITNETLKFLPETGSNKTIFLVITGVVLITIGLAFAWKKKK